MFVKLLFLNPLLFIAVVALWAIVKIIFFSVEYMSEYFSREESVNIKNDASPAARGSSDTFAKSFWISRYKEVIEFHTTHRKWPSRKSKDKYEIKLAEWCKSQRERYRKKTSDGYQLAMLEEVNFFLSTTNVATNAQKTVA